MNSVGVFTLYKYLCGSVQSVGEYRLPVCSVCSVKSVGASLRLRGRSLLLKRKLPRNSRNTQKFIAEKKTPTDFTNLPDVSKMFCVFREFCGSKYLCKSVKSVGEYSLPVYSVNSVNSVGGFNIGALSDMLVHFLLWQAAKPSGDKCTPWSVPLKLLQQERRLYAQIDAGSKTQLVVVAVHLVAYGEVVRGQCVENVSLHAPRESLAQFLRVA